MRCASVIFLLLVTGALLKAQTDSLALQKGIDYLENQGMQLSPYTAVFIPHLEKKYQVRLDIPDEIFLKRPKAEDEKTEIPILMRLVDTEGGREKAPYQLLASYQKMMFYPLYFETKGPQKNYMHLLDSFRMDTMGYGITHTLLSLDWAIERKCIYYTKKIRALRQWHIIRLERLIQAMAVTNDLRIEAMAILGEAAGGKALKRQWMDELIAAQQPDGGWNFWGAPKKGEPSHEHTTLLAVWALLAWTHPGAPATGWFSR